MRRRPLVLFTLVLAPLLVLASCGDDDESGSDDDTPAQGIDDPESEARSASIDFFGAQAVLDYEKAADRSSGPAQLGVTWSEQVNSVQQVRGTPYEVQPSPSPTVTVSFDSVSDNGDGTWSANGYVQLERYPGMLTPGPVPPSAAPAEEGWFVTDLLFREDGDRLVVEDYRMDDSPYPVSQLFVAYDEPDAEVTLDERADEAEEVSAGVVMRLGHRDLDRTVQYTFDLDPGDLDVDGAEFFADARLGDPPPPETVGSPVQLLRDVAPSSENPESVAEGEQPADPMTLGVRTDAFPGGEGILRVRFVDDDGAAVIIDVEVPEFGLLQERPTNTVRAAVVPTTTTTTTTTSTTTTTTTAPPQVVPVPVPVPAPTAPTTTAPPATTTTAAP